MNKESVEKGLSEWIIDIAPRASLFIGVSRFAPTKELYETLNTDYFKTSSEAYAAYQQLFIEFLPSDKYGYPGAFTVYWRQMPVLDETEHGFRIYSRIIISSSELNEDIIKGRINNA